jgi:hypothetical protein
MSSTTFSGPVTSQNGFIGTVTGSVTATTLSASGVVILSGLPTSDPAVAGQLWNDSGVLTVSAG